jgi:hypothetical protein
MISQDFFTSLLLVISWLYILRLRVLETRSKRKWTVKAIFFISYLFEKLCLLLIFVRLPKKEWEFTWKYSGLVVLVPQAKGVVPAMVNIWLLIIKRKLIAQTTSPYLWK